MGGCVKRMTGISVFLGRTGVNGETDNSDKRNVFLVRCRQSYARVLRETRHGLLRIYIYVCVHVEKYTDMTRTRQSDSGAFHQFSITFRRFGFIILCFAGEHTTRERRRPAVSRGEGGERRGRKKGF